MSELSEWEQMGERLRDRAAYSQGVKDTEERIIKKLESQLGAYGDTPDVTPDFGLQVAIALIKGEQK